MIATVHAADVGLGRSLAVLRKVPRPGSIPGLRQANLAVATRLSGRAARLPDLGRVALVALWDDDADVDRFVANHPLAQRFAGGWHVRLEPLRAWGSWPGLPPDIPRTRSVAHDGPAVVVTLGRLRISQTVRFFRASAKAEASAVKAPGLIWATAMARPPFVATCSLWQSSEALSTYAYGRADPGHADAIEAQKSKDFHHQSAFIRFHPYRTEGSLAGVNPLVEGWLAPA